MEKRQTGTVTWFSEDKGFGFIMPKDSTGTKEENVFLHVSSINHDFGYIEEGDLVEYDLEKTEKGLNALDVMKVSSPE